MDRASGPERGLPDSSRSRAAFPLTLTLSGTALAKSPPVTIDANIPPPTTFTHHLPFADLPEGIRSVAFAPDRDVLYVHYTTPIIDVWALAVSYWPELLGGFLFLWTLLALALAWRVKRRPQSPSAPHCRRCNYDLSPQVARRGDDDATFEVATDARCPECGVALSKHRPRRGRTLRRRLAPVLVLWLIPVIAYAAIHVAGVPRDGRISTWFDWSSSSLAALAKDRPIRILIPRIKQGDQIVEVDLASGRVTRTVATRRSETWKDLAVTPDGKSLIVTGDSPGQLQRISTRSGRRQSQVTLPHRDWGVIGFNRSILGFSPNGAAAYVFWSNGENALSGVCRWDMPSGQLTTLATTPATPAGHGITLGHPFFLRNASNESFISTSNATETSNSVRFHETGTDPRNGIPITGESFWLQTPQITSDGKVMYLFRDRSSVLAFDLETRTPIGVLSLGPSTSLTLGLRLSDDDRYLVAGSFYKLLVRDTRQTRWVASLAYPSAVYVPNFHISPTNSWVAAVMQTGTTTFRHELVLWNLAEILESSEHAQPTEPTP